MAETTQIYQSKHTGTEIDSAIDAFAGLGGGILNYRVNEEVDTGKIWVDGRKIYNRIFVFENGADIQLLGSKNKIHMAWVDCNNTFRYCQKSSSGDYKRTDPYNYLATDGSGSNIAYRGFVILIKPDGENLYVNYISHVDKASGGTYKVYVSVFYTKEEETT